MTRAVLEDRHFRGLRDERVPELEVPHSGPVHSHPLSGAVGGLPRLLGPPLQGQRARSPLPLEAFLTLPWQRVNSKNSGVRCVAWLL